MTKRVVTFILLLSCIFGSTVFISQAYAKGTEGNTNTVDLPSYVPGEILVKTKPGKTLDQVNSLFGSSTITVDKRTGVHKVKLPPGVSTSDLLSQYASNPNVEYAEPNYISKFSFLPNDTYYPNQWALSKISATSAWDISKGSPSVIIAIIDSGIDYNHPDLQGKIVSPYNSVLKSTSLTSVRDDVGHGTHVAGIAAASFNNGTGVAGVGGNVGIMPIKAGGAGGISALDSANAIYYAVDHGAKVINMSFGSTGYSSTEEAACVYAWNHNVVLVAATGNESSSTPTYPAAYDTVISVAATDQNDVDADFSNYGNWVAVSAPGVGIYSTIPTYANPLNQTNYGNLSGTSMSSPIVAGVAGLVLSVKPALSDYQVGGLILTNTDDIDTPGYDVFTGYGRVNAYKTLKAALAPAPTASASPAGGTYYNPQSIALSATQAYTTIYYTTNGSDPTLYGSKYTGPIAISSSSVLKYFALGLSGSSPVYTQNYTIAQPTVTAGPAGGSYTTPQAVTLTAAPANWTIYYTTNGSNPTTASSQYSGPINITKATTLKYFATGSTGTTQVYTQVYSIAPTVTISPSGATFDKPQQVALSMSGLGGKILYTIDGSNPTLTSPVYSQPISITTQKVIKYMAVDQYGNQSQIYTQTFAIVPTVTANLAGGTYSTAQSVTLTSSEPSTIYYTTDGSIPTSASTVYNGAISITKTTTLKYLAKDSAGNTSQIYSQTYNFAGVITESVRLAGSNRLATAVAISQKTFPNSQTADAVLLATGLDFPDALAGASLGKIKNAPLLLVTSYEQSAVTLNEIQRVLKPGGSVYILGGEGVVPPIFATNLQGKGYSVKRLAGANRYATAVAIATEVKAHGGGEVIVATGANFPDSLSISSYAAANGIPMVLVQENTIPIEVLLYLGGLGPTKITIVGGTGVVSSTVESSLTQLKQDLTIRRFGGVDRFDTCAKINQALYGNNSSTIFVATGFDFPDALAGSVLAGFNNAPIILVGPTQIPDAVLGYITQLNHKKVVTLGGEGVLSGDVSARIIGYVQ
jgi:subtilisin family serine protease/putative cell wall-binding protein